MRLQLNTKVHFYGELLRSGCYHRQKSRILGILVTIHQKHIPLFAPVVFFISGGIPCKCSSL